MRIYLLFIATAVLVISGCNHKSNHNNEITKYTVSVAVKKDTIVYREYVAQIRSYQHVELRALEQGYLQKIYVDEGQFVKKGDLLFQLMPVVFEAEKQKALAEYNKAEIEYKNTKALADSNIVSKNELALSKAVLDKAKSELDLAEAHLQFTQIRAPFDGIVGRFNDVRQGSLLEEGELLTTLSDISKMWVYFNVPESYYIEFIKKHNPKEQKHKVLLQLANGDIYENSGIVETIESDFNNETGNIAFRATFTNEKSILRHGQTGKILMPEELKNAVLLPQKATFEVLDKKYVYIVKNNKIESRLISVGYDMPHLFQINAGITEKDTVLVDGLRKVKQGDRIEPVFMSIDEIVKELQAIKAE